MRTIERTVSAAPETVWELWTTAAGISRWWAPDGFRTEGRHLDLQEGGELIYTMTAEAPEQVAFMEQNGLPLSTESRKVFADIEPPNHLSYRSLVDFVPDHPPYEQLTLVDLEAVADGTRIVMQVEEMHDDVWTERLIAGRANELNNLARILA
jgi:uncharacterized protein YndB with AHSA1/START domain